MNARCDPELTRRPAGAALPPPPEATRRVPCGPARVRHGELLRHDPQPPCCIHCASGTVWVTVDGDLRDFVLTAGQCVTVRERRPALIMGLEPAAIRIDSEAAPVQQRAPPQRWWSRGPARLVQRWRRMMRR